MRMLQQALPCDSEGHVDMHHHIFSAYVLNMTRCVESLLAIGLACLMFLGGPSYHDMLL